MKKKRYLNQLEELMKLLNIYSTECKNNLIIYAL
jgi:hypothetical protein